MLLLALSSLTLVAGINNGLGIKPPMGWRSWNLYGADVTEELIKSIMAGMVVRKNTVDGVPTSLLDLGYRTVGLDDNWQLCGSYGPDKTTYHDANGNPVVNTARFPDLKNMTDYAHSLGLKAGWYGNNCICSDHGSDKKYYVGDVNAMAQYGFDAIKLDGCGAEYDLQLWADEIESHGKAIEIENCHWGGTLPNATWCPWNFYRTSGDVRANFGSIMGNLATVIPLADKNLSTPGCYAYADMLEVGCKAGPGGSSDTGLTMEETRTHFGGWAIVSSPLTLSHDVTNQTITDFIWPVISNPEAIAVNQDYFGHSGSAFIRSSGPPSPGKYVLALPCNSSDATQQGWAYSPAAQTLTYGGQCVDDTTQEQVLLAPCDPHSSHQKYTHAVSPPTTPTSFQPLSDPGQCLDIWAGNGPPGGPAVQIYGCHTPSSNQQFIVGTGPAATVSNADNLCFTSRAADPGQLSFFYKPQSWDRTKYAILLVNVDDVPMDLTFSFATVPGLVGTSCGIRDIWGRKDLGQATGSYTAQAVGVHDAAFLMITCA